MTKPAKEMDRDELADHLSEDHDMDAGERARYLLLEDHAVDHKSVISQRLIIRHKHQ